MIKPILFNTEMVRTIQDDRKTATRRVAKWCVQEVYDAACFHGKWHETYNPANPPDTLVEWYLKNIKRPPYKPGDILYVRETWHRDVARYMYKADYSENEKFYMGGKEIQIKWQPSIHMPKKAARLFLRVTGVWVERLQDISDEDAEKEGCEDYTSTALGFPWVWDGTIPKKDLDRYGWNANPWVWVYEFERISKEEASK